MTLLFCCHFAKATAQDTLVPISIQDLVTEYKPAKVLNYDDAREVLYKEIYNVNDSVYCMYSGYVLPLAKDARNPISKLMRFNARKSIITEHAYPRSKGARYGNAKSDMHHLFPVQLGVNVARYNYPFGEVMDKQCNTWYRSKKKYKSKPRSAEGRCAKSGNDTFEPRDDFKGNIARAIFYFYTMYQAEALAADSTFFEQQRATLLQWHEQDPPDALEIERSYQIAKYQGEPNPFVVVKGLVERVYGE